MSIELANGHRVPRSLSHTRIDKFLRCPLAYKFQYVDDRERLGGRPLRIGLAVHECLEHYMEHIIDNGIEKDVEAMKELAYEQDIPADEWNEMFNICMNFARNNLFDEPFNNPKIESQLALDKHFNQTDWRADDAVIRGVFDFIEREDDDAIIITDYKTNRKIPSQTSLDNNLQLEIYAWMLSKVADFDIVQTKLWFVRYNKQMSRTITLNEINNHIEDKLMGFFDQMAQHEENESYPARVSKECSWCDFANICPEYEKRRDDLELDELEIEDESDAIERAEDLKMMTRIRSDLRAELKNYVENTQNPVEMNDQELNYHPTTSYNFNDKQSLFERLIEIGFSEEDVWQAFKVNKTDLKSLLRDEGLYHLYDELKEELAEPDPGTRFSFKDIDD